MTTAVLLCADGAPEPSSPVPNGVRIVREPALCEHPGRIADLAAAASTLVVGLCPGRTARREVQTAARRAGLDALGVEAVDLAAVGRDADRLSVLVAAAVARARAFAGSRAEHAKPVFAASMSRRSLLRLPLPEYAAVPAVEQDLCAAGDGCHACVDVCPQDAYTWSDGRVEVDPDRCEPCGRCLTACPTGAARNPAWTPQQVRAEILALLTHGNGEAQPRGIVYTCQRGERTGATPGWFPVEVPCTGMLTLNWLLAPLLMGAGAVTARRCGDIGCGLAGDARVDAVMGLARETLARVGVDPHLVRADTAAPPATTTLGIAALTDPFGPAGAAEVLLALAERAGTPQDVRIASPAATTGEVTVSAACTVCGACAAACPTGALGWTHDGGQAVLTFDAAGCTACGQCLPRCPERDAGAIAMESVIDLPLLRAGRRTLLRDDVVACRSCGRPFASQRLLDRVADLLGEDHAAVAPVVDSYCLSCRGQPARRTSAPISRSASGAGSSAGAADGERLPTATVAVLRAAGSHGGASGPEIG